MSRLAIGFLFLVACGTATPVSPPPAAADLSWNDTGPLLEQLRAAAEQARVPGVVEDIDLLRQKWGETTTATTPAQYAESLNDDRDALVGGDAEQMRAAAEDLHLKASHCRAGAPWNELVTVQAHTKRDGAPVPGKQVMVCRRGWANVPSKWRPLRKLSSPAVGELSPGTYVFRVGGEAPSTQKIGGDGRPTYDFDLVIP
ncbi:MAG: hypothetical protein AABO58_08050 [Acidobacteriota bacterium]